MTQVKYFYFFLIFLFLILLPSLALAGAMGVKRSKDVSFVIDSDSMEADSAGKVVTFSGRVSAREEFTLCSDELKIFYNDKREINNIIATGQVKFLVQGKVATARKAEYNMKTSTVILSGEPKIVHCGDMVSGDRLTFNMDKETALIEAGSDSRVRALIMSKKVCPEEDFIEKDFCRRAR